MERGTVVSQSAPATRLQPGADLPTRGGHLARVRSWRGEGSYARVFAGTYSASGGSCAVKIAKGEIPEALSRLDAEAGVLRQLQHRQVVQLLDHGTVSEMPFLVLEWLDGETLHDLIHARRRLALRQSLEILQAAAEGVAHIHERRLVHGDLRAENVIIVPGRCAVLTDPGLGGSLAEDLRSLGRLLHQMLTGEAPLDGVIRLQASAGYNRNVVQLWERTQSAPAFSAAELLAEVRRLRAAL